MSTRVTYAAKTLAQQILEHWPDAIVTNGGEPDGLGVLRQLEVARPEAEEIMAVLLPIAEHDSRLRTLELPVDGSLIITFSSATVADRRDRFPIREVLKVQKASEADETGAQSDEQVEDGPKVADGPKKRSAAKKAASGKGDA